MNKPTLEETYVMAVLNGVLRAEVEKIDKQGLRTTAGGKISKDGVRKIIMDLIKKIENSVVPF